MLELKKDGLLGYGLRESGLRQKLIFWANNIEIKSKLLTALCPVYVSNSSTLVPPESEIKKPLIPIKETLLMSSLVRKIIRKFQCNFGYPTIGEKLHLSIMSNKTTEIYKWIWNFMNCFELELLDTICIKEEVELFIKL